MRKVSRELQLHRHNLQKKANCFNYRSSQKLQKKTISQEKNIQKVVKWALCNISIPTLFRGVSKKKYLCTVYQDR